MQRLPRKRELIEKPDEFTSGSKREKYGVLVGGHLKMNWVGEVNDESSDSDEVRHPMSDIERDDEWCIKGTWTQWGHTSNLQPKPAIYICVTQGFQNIPTSGAETTTAGLSVFNVLTSSPWSPGCCGVPAFGRPKSSSADEHIFCVGTWNFQNSLRWRRDSSTAENYQLASHRVLIINGQLWQITTPAPRKWQISREIMA